MTAMQLGMSSGRRPATLNGAWDQSKTASSSSWPFALLRLCFLPSSRLTLMRSAEKDVELYRRQSRVSHCELFSGGE